MGHWELVGVKGALGAGEGLRAGLLTAHYMEHLYQDTRTPLKCEPVHGRRLRSH